jgi:hypothetical protein
MLDEAGVHIIDPEIGDDNQGQRGHHGPDNMDLSIKTPKQQNRNWCSICRSVLGLRSNYPLGTEGNQSLWVWGMNLAAEKRFMKSWFTLSSK